jgi:hypothetical protein
MDDTQSIGATEKKAFLVLEDVGLRAQYKLTS